MKILGFDTSNDTVSVAISEGDEILAYLEELQPAMQAERLSSMIEQALRIANITYYDINYLAVTKGPGSFTGIRVGLATAQAILLAANLKGIAVTNFEIEHVRAIKQVGNYDEVIVLINAYRNQLYIQTFNKLGAKNAPLLIDCDLAGELLRKKQNALICAGSGTLVMYEQIKKMPNAIILPRIARKKAIHICRYTSSQLLLGGNDNLAQLEPLYIRPADAMLKFNNKSPQ